MASPKLKACPQDNLLSCPICMDIYKSPRMLPCQHTLCESCLHTYIVNKSKERVLVSDFPCPVCRTSTPAPRAFTRIDTWSTLFPLNHLLVSLLDSSLQEYIDKGNEYNIEKCPDHQGKAIEFFCTDHEAKLCSKCFKNSHRQCDIVDIEDHVAFTSRYSSVKQDMEAIQKYLNDAIFHLKTNIEQLLSQKNAILADVKDFRNKIESLLNSFETDIKDQVNVKHDGEVVLLKAQCEKYERIKAEVDVSEGSLNDLPVSGNIVQSLESLTTLEGDLKNHMMFLNGSHSAIKVIKLEFALEDQLLAYLNSFNKIGNVYISRLDASLNKPPETSPREGTHNDSFTSSRSELSPGNHTQAITRHLSPRSATTGRPADSACQLGNSTDTTPPRSHKQPKRPITVPIESASPTPIVRPRAERPEIRGIPQFHPRSCSSPVHDAQTPTPTNGLDPQQGSRNQGSTCSDLTPDVEELPSGEGNKYETIPFDEPDSDSGSSNSNNKNGSKIIPQSKDSFPRHRVWQYVNIEPGIHEPHSDGVAMGTMAREMKHSVFRQPFRSRTISVGEGGNDNSGDQGQTTNSTVKAPDNSPKRNGQSNGSSPLYENTPLNVTSGTAFATILNTRRRIETKPDPARKPDTSPKTCVKVNEICGQIDSDTHDCTITGSVELKDRRLVLVDCNNSSVKLFSKEFVYQNHLDMGKEPWNIAIVSDDDVAVTVPLEKSIHIIRISNNVMSTSRCITTRRECWGICHVDDKFIITTKDNGNIVLFLDSNGRELQIVNFASRENPNILRPVSITASPIENVIYVCCEGQSGTRGSIVRMSLRGDILYVLTNKDVDRPYSTAVDKDGNILVTAIRSANVVRFSEGGANVVTVLSRDKGLCRPQHIQVLTYDRNALFLLTERRSDTISVYEVR